MSFAYRSVGNLCYNRYLSMIKLFLEPCTCLLYIKVYYTHNDHNAVFVSFVDKPLFHDLRGCDFDLIGGKLIFILHVFINNYDYFLQIHEALLNCL